MQNRLIYRPGRWDGMGKRHIKMFFLFILSNRTGTTIKKKVALKYFHTYMMKGVNSSTMNLMNSHKLTKIFIRNELNERM